jgi:nucleoside-diphosphate-sugar epimerase
MQVQSKSTVLILGAKGRLGSALSDAFTSARWRVLKQARATPGRDMTHLIAADVRDVGGIVNAANASARRIDVVINATNPIYTRWATEAEALNRAAIEITQTLGATLMFPGNVYNYGADMPEALRSDTPQLAQTRKGRIRITMEQAILAATKAGTQAIVIRAGDFFGCNAGSWFDQAIARDSLKGKLTYPGPLDRPHAWAYVPDLAQTFVRVAEARAALGRFECIHFTGHTLTGHELKASIEGAVGAPVNVARLPWPLIRAVGLVWPMWRELAEMAYLWQRPHQLVTDSAHRAWLSSTTPIDDAIRSSVAALHPQLAARFASEAAVNGLVA